MGRVRGGALCQPLRSSQALPTRSAFDMRKTMQVGVGLFGVSQGGKQCHSVPPPPVCLSGTESQEGTCEGRATWQGVQDRALGHPVLG